MNEGRKLDPKILDEIIRRIVDVAQPEEIILFGSAARGEMGPNSDIDLLVIKSGANRLDLAGQLYKSMHGVGAPVDIIVATPEDIERYRNRRRNRSCSPRRQGHLCRLSALKPMIHKNG